MMARFYGNDITGHVMALVDELSATLGLKVIARGSLAILPAPEQLTDWLDAVIVKPANVTGQDAAAERQIRDVYDLSIFFLRRFQPTEEAFREQVSRAEQIAQKLHDNRGLPALTLPAPAWVEDTEIRGLVHDSEDLEFFWAALNYDILMSRIDFRVIVRTR